MLYNAPQYSCFTILLLLSYVTFMLRVGYLPDK
jgi:hypothetical protein